MYVLALTILTLTLSSCTQDKLSISKTDSPMVCKYMDTETDFYIKCKKIHTHR